MPERHKTTRWPLAGYANRAGPRGFWLLLGFQDEGPVPVRRRWVLPEGLEARGIKIEYIFQAKAVVGFAAPNNRLSSAIEIALPVAREHLADSMMYPLKAFAASNVRATKNCINGFGLGFPFHRYKINLKHSKFLAYRLRRFRTDDDRHAVIFRLPFQARCQIDRIAEHRIVETQIGAHIADDASPRVEPDADLDREEALAGFFGLLLALLIQRLDAAEHFQRGFARIDLVRRVVQRRVPERHDRVADIFVDRTVVFDDGVGHRCEEIVHQRRQTLRIVLVYLRNRGEAAHVAEQDRHVAILAAERQRFMRFSQLLDQRRGEILAEGGTDTAALDLLAEIIDEDQRQINGESRKERKSGVEQNPLLGEEVPGTGRQPRGQGGTYGEHHRGPKNGPERNDGETDQDRHTHFGGDRIIRIDQDGIRQHVFQHLHMHFDAGHRWIDRGRYDVAQADRGRAEQNQFAGNPVGRHAVLQNVLDRDVADRIVRAEMNPKLTVAIGRQFKTRDGDAVDTAGIALDYDCAGVGGHAQHFERQCRDYGSLRLHRHGYPAHDTVGLGVDGDQTATGGSLFENRDIADHAGKGDEIRAWVRSQHRESDDRRLRCGVWQCHVVTRLAEHDPRLANGIGENLIVAWQFQELRAGLLVEITEALRRNSRRHPVRFGKNDVERDRSASELCELGD